MGSLDSPESPPPEVTAILDAATPILRTCQEYLTQLVQDKYDSLIIYKDPYQARAVGISGDSVMLLKSPEERMYGSLTNRLKIMAGIDLAVKDRRQTGELKVRLQGKDCRIKVTTTPNPFGSEDTSLSLEDSI